MRYQLDTIPVWDATREAGECPLCSIRARNERMYVDSFLGASVMEPDTRVEVNEKGFCAHHFNLMFQEKNRLGLALMTHTHLKEVIKSLQGVLDNPGATSGGLNRLFGRGSSEDGSAAQKIESRVGSCVLCQRLDYTMNRYAYTLVYLWEHDKDYRQAFEASKGLCIPHMARVMRMADEQLSGKTRTEFLGVLAKLQKENLARIAQELEWFTLKFDYRNQDKPWGNSRDAVERAIDKLKGLTVGKVD